MIFFIFTPIIYLIGLYLLVVFDELRLGSTSYITTRNGSISQHVEYIAFGEVLFEEHASSFSSPYLFNGKELDRETNLSYYSARYLDMKTSLWLNVDPLTEKTLNYGAYVYTFNNPIRFIDPTGMSAEPPTGVDAEDGAVHSDNSGTWIYEKETTTWKGQNGAKDLGNTIALDEVKIKGYKSNYVPSGEYGPDRDPVHAAMAAGVVVLPVLAVEGVLAAGGSYLLAEGAAALSQITLKSAAINMAGNATAQYFANDRDSGKINLISTVSSVIPGIGPVIFGESIGWTPNNIMKGEGLQKPSSPEKWATQVGAAILSNRFGKASDNYLSGTGFGETMVKEYFKTIIGVGANSVPQTVK